MSFALTLFRFFDFSLGLLLSILGLSLRQSKILKRSTDALTICKTSQDCIGSNVRVITTEVGAEPGGGNIITERKVRIS